MGSVGVEDARTLPVFESCSTVKHCTLLSRFCSLKSMAWPLASDSTVSAKHAVYVTTPRSVSWRMRSADSLASLKFDRTKFPGPIWLSSPIVIPINTSEGPWTICNTNEGDLELVSWVNCENYEIQSHLLFKGSVFFFLKKALKWFLSYPDTLFLTQTTKSVLNCKRISILVSERKLKASNWNLGIEINAQVFDSIRPKTETNW